MEIGGDLTWHDYLAFTLYFFAIISIGFIVIIKQRRGNVQNYFLAGRTMPWYAVGGSLFSSNVGTEMILALSGAGAAAGISLVMYEWLPIFIIMIFSWYLLPVYVSAGVYTLPEYMEKRFGGNRLRNYLSVVSIVIIIVSKMVTVMFSGSIFVQVAVNWNMYVAIAVLLIVSMFFTMVGGLKAVMVVGALQTMMVMVGGVLIAILSFDRIGGYENLERLYAESVPHQRSNNTTCGLPRTDAFHVFQSVIEGDQPWPGLVLQASLGGLYNWCCNQILIQRSLAARSLSDAKAGAVMLSVIKIFPLFLIIFPGMISRILYPDEVACADPDICMRICDNPAGCSNIAYPMLILGILPIGVRGLLIAVMLSGIMIILSSVTNSTSVRGLLIAVMLSGIMITLSSVTNSTSTVFTMDIWRKLRPTAKQRELMLVGRLSVVVICTVAILWVPFVKAFQNGRLFSYILSVGGYLGSPIGALFCLSVMWTKVTEQGVFWGMIASHSLGVVRLVLELIHPAPSCRDHDDNRSIISRLHYTYFAQIQIVFAVIAASLISQITKRRSNEQLEGVTWWTRVTSYEECHVDDEVELDVMKSRRESEMKKDLNLKLDTLQTVTAKTEESSVEKTFYQRVTTFLCGTNEEITEEAHFDMATTKAFLKEDANTASLLNVIAFVLMIIVGFVIGYFR